MLSISEVTFDILGKEQAEIAELIGIESYRILMEYYAGTSIYIPKLSEIEREKRNQKIRKEYEQNGNMKALAIKYDLSEIQIRNIVLDIYKEKKNAPVDGQMSMFEL